MGPGYDAPGAPFAHSTKQEHREDKMLITFFQGDFSAGISLISITTVRAGDFSSWLQVLSAAEGGVVLRGTCFLKVCREVPVDGSVLAKPLTV